MRLREQFMAEVAERFMLQPNGLAVLPQILSRASAVVLGAAGAGISITLDELRVPLGASDEEAARAERLQTTLGEGPCLVVSTTSDPFLAGAEVLAQRWPVFHGQVLQLTSFRSIASLPIRSPGLPPFGALDVYWTEDDVPLTSSLHEISDEIGDQIAGLLFEAPTVALEHGITLPLWLAGDSVTRRMNVWVAVGMLIEHAGLTNADALAALRAYAFGHDLTLDEAADRLTNEDLEPGALLA